MMNSVCTSSLPPNLRKIAAALVMKLLTAVSQWKLLHRTVSLLSCTLYVDFDWKSYLGPQRKVFFCPEFIEIQESERLEFEVED